ncbi:MAG: cyclic nucleotide-binding domain-containing protein, partial [Candidatus Promineifilaceae bacterium]
TVDAPYMAAKNVMLQPLPAYLRTQTQTAATGIAYPLATGLSGLLLLFLTNVLGFQSVQISYAILVILALWAFVVYRLGRVYVQHLRQALLAHDGLRSGIGGPGILLATDRTTISVLEEALRATGTPNPSAALYALKRLAEVAPETLSGHLPELLTYPQNDVRTAVLDYMTGVSWNKAPPADARSAIDDLLASDGPPEVRAAALRAWYAVSFPSAGSPSAGSGSASSGQASENTTAERLAVYARDPQMAVRRSALAIMLSHQETALLPAPAMRRQAPSAGSGQAWEMLDGLVHSANAADRILAAGVIGEIEKRGRDRDTANYVVVEELLALLGDGDGRVVRAALAGSAHTCSPEVWAAMIPALAGQSTCSEAVNALSAGGEDVLPLLQAACQVVDQDPRIVAGIAKVCGRVGGADAVDILKSLAAHPDATVRRQTLLGLSRCAYEAEAEERAAVKEQFNLSAAALAQISAAQADIGDAAQVRLTADALEQRRETETDNLLLLLSFLDEPQTVLGAREALRLGDGEEETRAYAIEMLDILLEHDLKSALFPFIQQLAAQERVDAFQKQFPQTLLGRRQRLDALVTGEDDRWTRICAIYGLSLVHDVVDEAAGEAAAKAASAVLETAVRFSHDPVLVETALASLESLGVCPESIDDPALGEGMEQWRARDPQGMTLLQKVDALKQAGMLADLPGETLEAVASLLKIVTTKAGETIIQMGDPGDCMYIVVDGRLRVHAGERDLDTVGVGDVIGEMALLDGEPRSASVTAVTGCRLLQLDQDPFYDLMALDPRVARGILHLLSARLRERTADMALQAGSEVAPPVQPIMRGHGGRVHYAPYAQGVPGQGELPVLERFLFLRGIDFFSGIDDDLLEQVTLLLEEVDLARGEQLFAQGDAGHSLYIVAAGQVRIHIEGRTLAYAEEGEVIGEMVLLESGPRSATVTGSVDSLLLRLDQRPFFELLEVEPELARGMIRTLSGRLRGRLLELANDVSEAVSLAETGSRAAVDTV